MRKLHQVFEAITDIDCLMILAACVLLIVFAVGPAVAGIVGFRRHDTVGWVLFWGAIAYYGFSVLLVLWTFIAMLAEERKFKSGQEHDK